MKKVHNSLSGRDIYYLKKILLTMKISTLLLIVNLLHISAIGYSQGEKLNVQLKNASLKEMFSVIEKQTGYKFLYRDDVLENIEVNIQAKDMTLNEVLHKALERSSNSYLILDNKLIVISSKETLQQKKITGTITDGSTGEPIVGANIIIEGTTIGTTTDIDGKFTLDINKDNAILIISFLGYNTERVAFTGQSNLSVQLIPDIKSLEEVVVVGYGTQKKVNLTGSVSTVNNDDLAKKQVGQTSMALQGIVPGVTVTQRSGQPGRDGGSIRIRGIGTLGDSNPLVLMDGVETSINNIDPNEIETMSVLKDAASAAIYGSRAANGVILITTKRAKANTFSINYNTYIGWQQPTDLPKIVNAVDHMEMINEAYVNVGRTPLYSQDYINEYKTLGPTNRDKYPDTDWQKLTVTENGFTQNHYLGLNAGGDKVRVLGSFNYIDQDGIIANTNFKRYNFRLNSDIQLNKKFSSSFDLSLRRTNLTEPSSGTGYIFHWMRRIPANQGGVLSNGKYGEGWNGDHPLARAKDGGLNTEEAMSAIMNFTLKYKPTEWLTAMVNYAPKYNEPHYKSFSNIIQTYKADLSPSYAVPAKNSLNESFSREWYNNLSATITADKTFADTHQLTFLAGFQQEDFVNSNISAYREVFLLPEYQMINSGNRLNEKTGGSGSHWALRSVFGRLTYNFNQKYLFEANARYDGSSRFAKGNRYSFFPSVSAGWRISEEEFMKLYSNTITNLKLRASWGQLGNQNIGLYPYASFVNIGGSNYLFGDLVTTGASLNDMANSKIKWETTEASDIGLDLSLWSKLTVTADYYYRKTNDILLRLDVPQMIGLTAPYQNAGVVENKGWELSVNYHNNIGDFTYDITANLSDVKNKIVDMKGINKTGLQVNLEGNPMSSLYGYQAVGYFKDAEDVAHSAKQFGTVAPGDIKYQDMNGDSIINNLDQKVLGSVIPRYTYSLNVDLGYKGFDFSMFIQGVGEANGYLYGQGIMPFNMGGTVQEQHKDHWTPDNTDAKFPRFAFNEINNEQNSSFWMKDASYLRLKNIQVGYSLPKSVLQKVSIQNLRIYVSGQNLFTFDKFWDGYDVEAPVSDGGWYPQLKIYSVGLDVKF